MGGKYMPRKLFCQLGPWAYWLSLRKEWLLRALRELFSGKRFASVRSRTPLPCIAADYRSLVRRPLPGVDPALQENKAVNVRLACERLDGLLVRPGETFSFWRLIGRPTAKKGYLDGLVIAQGRPGRGTGGGLCMLANAVNLLVLHSPLTVTERHHHTDALFPDVGRRVPFGTGTSVFYNNVDYQFRNDLDQTVQLCVRQDEGDLCAELRAERPFPCRYRLTEEGLHYEREGADWYRVSEVYRTSTDRTTGAQRRELMLKNHSKVLYAFDPENAGAPVVQKGERG